MKARLLRILILVVVVSAGGAVGLAYLQNQLDTPYPAVAPAQPKLVEVSRGLGSREVIHLLRENDVIPSESAGLAYLLLSGNRGRLRAGEYAFDRPMTVPEVVEKLVKGIVHLHKFTVPEGLTIDKTAARWEEQGFGKAEDFRKAATDSVSLIRDLDDQADSLEGYLFPETYMFARGVTARQAVETMVRRFRTVLAKLEQVHKPEDWPFGFRETVILASIIESEAGVEDERAVIASVYTNRLKIKMLLQCDPTVIYALERNNRYSGTLTRTDLRFDSPYNTYRYPGLPPGPIASAGLRSFLAAINPASTRHLYFVRTVDDRHTFSDSLAEHNRAVARYRAMRSSGG